MKSEIERKFLVNSNDFIKDAHCQYDIIQGFLNRNKNRTVRVRIKAKKGFITVKGISSKDGTSRFEWEKEIDLQDAKDLLKLCEGDHIHKTRYEIANKNFIFEVDVFHKKHAGLVIAEIELQNKNDTFYRPKWLGKEVTGDQKYYNSQL